MKKILLGSFIFLFFATKNIFAAELKLKEWRILPHDSKIEFFAKQAKSDIRGSFTNFSGKILFDKNNIAKSEVEMLVNIDSLEISFKEAKEMLKTQEWFFTKNFPQARFYTKKFSAIDKNKFHCEGFLKIKGTELPTNFDFTFSEFSTQKAVAIGEFSLKRTAFGLGGKNNEIDDLVRVQFTISAN